MRFMIRDRDAKYTGSLDEVVRSEGAEVIVTPMRSPEANAFAERSVRTARDEVLDHVLDISIGSLCTFERRYNAERSHSGIELRVPDGASPLAPVDDVPRAQRRDLLGGLIHEYYAVVA